MVDKEKGELHQAQVVVKEAKGVLRKTEVESSCQVQKVYQPYQELLDFDLVL